MRKFIVIFSVVVLMLTICLYFIFKNKDNSIEEETYCVKSAYSLLSDGNCRFDIKLYSNKKESLLLYAKESQIYLHDKSKNNMVSVIVEEVSLTNFTSYNEKEFCEYTLSLLVKIDKLKIEDCWLTLEYPNKTYTFLIGDFEIVKNIYQENELKITNLYGLRSENILSLNGIVMTITNPLNKSILIKNIDICDGYKVILNEENTTEIKESSTLENQSENICYNNNYISLNPNESITILLPITTTKNLYLFNCYMLIDIDGSKCYFPNFTYINSCDLDELSPYLNKGIIYEI